MKPHELVRSYIKEQGLKQCAVAERAGYSARDLSLMLTGKKKFLADDLSNICRALSVSPELFIEVQKPTG